MKRVLAILGLLLGVALAGGCLPYGPQPTPGEVLHCVDEQGYVFDTDVAYADIFPNCVVVPFDHQH